MSKETESRLNLTNMQKPTNADNILFRASQMTDIMSGVKTKKSVADSDTCRKRLIKIFNEVYWGRKDFDRENKYCEKGTLQESEGIRLLIESTRQPFKKNEERHTNEYFSCITDILSQTVDVTIDIKCSWSLNTFSEAMTSDVKSTYLYQGQVQMDVHKRNKHWLVYCLVNNTADLIQKEIDYLRFKFDQGSPNWEKAARQVQMNHIFDMELFQKNNLLFDYIITPEQWKEENLDIPKDKRIFRFEIEKDEAIVSAMKSRIDDCRSWMNKELFKI